MAAHPARLGLAALVVAVLSAPSPADCLSAVLQPGAVPTADAVVGALGLLVHALAAWLLAVAALTLGSRAPARLGRACRALLPRCAPAGLRRAVAVALGTGLLLAGSAPLAQAAPRPAAAAPSFDWPGLAPPPEPSRPRARPAAAPEAVRVRPGDTLWELAARSLPRPATDADRAAEWPRWWAANRDVVGDDPDLLLPGQRLVAPPSR